MAEAIEMTSFKLVAGTDAAAFVAANDGVTAWLEHQPGFIRRVIAESEDATIVDVVFWRSLAEGKSAADRVIGETADSPVHDMIDVRTVHWLLAEIRAATPAS